MSKEKLLQIIEQTIKDNAKILDLSNQRLKTLPPEIGQLVNLKGLYLVRNQLKTLPHEIGNLKSLTVLFLTLTN